MRAICFFSILVLVSCSHPDRLPAVNSYYYHLNQLNEDDFQKEYQQLKSRMNEKRQDFFTRSNNSKMEKIIPEAQHYLNTTLNDSIFHFWLNTPWDFNGITETPGKGNIACGYFVTTTLRHAGFKIDRVKLAQQAASVIINTLCDQTTVKIFSNKNISGLKKYVNSLDEGLYIIGLDNHVGFIQKKDTSAYMIHSSGVPPLKVMIQNIHECGPVLWSSFHMIGNLTGNKKVIEKWIKSEEIPMSI